MSHADLITQFRTLLESDESQALINLTKEVSPGEQSEALSNFLLVWLAENPKESQLQILAPFLIKLSNDAPEMFAHVAQCYYNFGKLSRKGYYFLHARDCMTRADGVDNPSLWGKILVALGSYLDEEHFFHEAMQQFAQVKEQSDQLLWEWGVTWMELSTRSGEISDLKQALSLFAQVKVGSSLFYCDYGLCLERLASYSGLPHHLEEAIILYQLAITKDPQSEAWTLCALAHSKLYDLTHSQKDFEKADRIFEEAVLAVPHQSKLWIEWGALFLSYGWNKASLKELEVAAERFTSIKTSECNPIEVTALLGQTLATLGLLLEDYQLIREGKKRVLEQLAITPDYPRLIYASGAVHLIEGLYFSEPLSFARSIDFFQKETATLHASFQHGLFQAYYSWGQHAQEPNLIEKSLKPVATLAEAYPSSPFYLTNWGIALLELHHLTGEEQDLDEALEKLKSALAIRDDLDTLFHYAHALTLTEDKVNQEKAIEILRKLHFSMPTDLRIQLQLADTLLHYGELNEDVESLHQSVELFSSATKRDPQNEMLYCQLGDALLALATETRDPNHPEKCNELFEKAEKELVFAIQLGSSEAHYHLACLYSMTAHLDLAMHHLKRAEHAQSLPHLEDVAHDERLQLLASTEAFRDFLTSRERG